LGQEEKKEDEGRKEGRKGEEEEAIGS